MSLNKVSSQLFPRFHLIGLHCVGLTTYFPADSDWTEQLHTTLLRCGTASAVWGMGAMCCTGVHVYCVVVLHHNITINKLTKYYSTL